MKRFTFFSDGHKIEKGDEFTLDFPKMRGRELRLYKNITFEVTRVGETTIDLATWDSPFSRGIGKVARFNAQGEWTFFLNGKAAHTVKIPAFECKLDTEKMSLTDQMLYGLL